MRSRAEKLARLVVGQRRRRSRGVARGPLAFLGRNGQGLSGGLASKLGLDKLSFAPAWPRRWRMAVLRRCHRRASRPSSQTSLQSPNPYRFGLFAVSAGRCGRIVKAVCVGSYVSQATPTKALHHACRNSAVTRKVTFAPPRGPPHACCSPIRISNQIHALQAAPSRANAAVPHSSRALRDLACVGQRRPVRRPGRPTTVSTTILWPIPARAVESAPRATPVARCRRRRT